MSLEKNVELKCMQVNELKSETSMKRKCGVIQTDYSGSQCIDALGIGATWLQWMGERLQDRVESCFDLEVASNTCN